MDSQHLLRMIPKVRSIAIKNGLQSIMNLCIMQIVDVAQDACAGDISREAAFRPAQVTRAMSLLRSAGYILVGIDLDDRRKVMVSLTEDGKKALAKCRAEIDAVFTNVSKEKS